MTQIVALVGSLRQKSFNKALLRAAIEEAPDGVHIQTTDLSGLPLFSEDLEAAPPAAVTTLKQQIEAADAVLLVTPEYNYSIPGVLKNAIDWASRPYGRNSFAGKPGAIMGASVGALGSGRAQYHLRQVCQYLDIRLINKPEVLVATASKQFDESGRLTNDDTRKQIRKVLDALVEWTAQLRR